MASRHTEQYGLNLWEPGDSVLREEFNENTQKIEAALDKYKSVTGTYTGTGQEQTISIGFRPKLVLIVSRYVLGAITETNGATAHSDGGTAYMGVVEAAVLDDGFRLNTYERYFNNSGVRYTYIAFR